VYVFTPPKLTVADVVFVKPPEPANTASTLPLRTKNELEDSVPFVTAPASKVNTPDA
jgi:hypothetical protein